MPSDELWEIVRNRLTLATGNSAYAAGRVYPVVLKQDTELPAETYQVITSVREHAMGADPGHVHARVQIDIYDRTYAGTASGGRHVRDALSRYNGTATGVVVQDVFVDNERDSFVENLEDADRRVWRRTLDFMIHFEE